MATLQERLRWDRGPHQPVRVEQTVNDFVLSIGGRLVSREIEQPLSFENADYLFPASGTVVELKEIETEFGSTPAFQAGFDALMRRLVGEVPDWRPALFGGKEPPPPWFGREFLRLFRPPLSRVLKKANRQIKATKDHFRLSKNSGTLLLVNDGFSSLPPSRVLGVVANLLTHSYSGIDCVVYMTVNSYVAFPGDPTPRLVWAPLYSEKADPFLHEFIDELGREWFRFLDTRIGPFSDWSEVPDGDTASVLSGTTVLYAPKRDGLPG